MKNKIAEYTSIPNCRQSLRGWVQPNEAYTNNTKLHTMSIARENELIVTDITGDDGSALDDDSIERLGQMYTLNILNEKDSNPLQLKFRGTQTILDIKTDVYTITNIAVRHQEWTGWPANVTNDTMLALTGIPLEHSLTLKSLETASSQPSSAFNNDDNRTARNHGGIPETIDIDSDSSVDEFEDASDFNAEDDIFTSPTTNRRIKHLSKKIHFFIYCSLLHFISKLIV